eukprot:scaffold194026_cov18-Prasinocladus_malaysianus.AAC.1
MHCKLMYPIKIQYKAIRASLTRQQVSNATIRGFPIAEAMPTTPRRYISAAIRPHRPSLSSTCTASPSPSMLLFPDCAEGSATEYGQN